GGAGRRSKSLSGWGVVGRTAATEHRSASRDREQAKDDASHGSRSPAWSDAAQVVDDVPHLLWSHLAVVALHVVLRADAVFDYRKNFRITRSVVPFVVGQIRWVSSLVRPGALRPLPLASSPWQKRQFFAKSALPLAID